MIMRILLFAVGLILSTPAFAYTEVCTKYVAQALPSRDWAEKAELIRYMCSNPEIKKLEQENKELEARLNAEFAELQSQSKATDWKNAETKDIARHMEWLKSQLYDCEKDLDSIFRCIEIETELKSIRFEGE